MEFKTIPSVRIVLTEECQEMDISYTFNNMASLDFCDYVDACKKAALAFGYGENLVKNVFGE